MMIASGLIFGWDLWLRWFPLILENLISPSEKWIEYRPHVGTQRLHLRGPARRAGNGWRRGFNCSPRSAPRHPSSSRSDRGWGRRERTAVFLAATVLAAPHSGPYDVTLLVIAAAFWLMSRAAPLPLWCWTLAFMIWLLPMLSPPLLFPVARIAPLLPVLLIVLLLRPEFRPRYAQQ